MDTFLSSDGFAWPVRTAKMRRAPLRALRYTVLTMLLVFSMTVAMHGNAVSQDRVLVFAASSLKDALDEIASRFEAATGTSVVISYAGSSAMARQIVQGAPADILFSASKEWMDYAHSNNAIDAASRWDQLSNRLVLIAPRGDAPARMLQSDEIASHIGTDRIAMALFEAVPAGQYGKLALVGLGIWSDLKAQIVEADNVRAAMAFVARGEVPFGIVYHSDAVSEERVEIISQLPLPKGSRITYSAALTQASVAIDNKQASEFMNFLRSFQAADIFVRYGFSIHDQGTERHGN